MKKQVKIIADCHFVEIFLPALKREIAQETGDFL